MLLIPLLLANLVWAQVVEDARPSLNTSSVAIDDSAASTWINPSLSAFGTGIQYGFYGSRGLDSGVQTVAGALSWRGIGVNVANFSSPLESSFWSIGTSGAVPLPYRLTAGFGANWYLHSNRRNRISYTAGLAWRPLPWFGVGAVAYNFGSPDPEGGNPARSTFGLALRPFGERLSVGIDFSRTFLRRPDNRLLVSARVQPIRGLGLLFSMDTNGQISAGIELVLRGITAGIGASSLTPDYGVSAWIDNAHPDQNLVPSKRKVPLFSFVGSPPNKARKFLFSEAETTWFQLLQQLELLAQKRTPKAALLQLRNLELSWAQCQELRQGIRRAREAGNTVVVYLRENPDTATYWVASAANTIFMHPAGQLDITGVSSRLWNASTLFSRLGVDFKVVRRGSYKSAVEQFTRSEPSAQSLEQTDALLDDRFETIVNGISSDRQLGKDKVLKWMDEAPFMASEALESGMVDLLVYPDQLESALSQMTSRRVELQTWTPVKRKQTWTQTRRIAVIVVEGMIVSGRSTSGFLIGQPSAGAETICEEFERAASDPHVRGILMRVDSPGGSAFASDEIWRCARTAQQTGKPLVVSMGGVAASGGYYIAAPADAIWAEATTVTGSIGIYMLIPETTQLFNELGIHGTTVQRGGSTGLYSTSEQWSPSDQKKADALIAGAYQQFKRRVSDGRRLTDDQVEVLAGGRVWSGLAAKENGLVDRLGGFQDALQDVKRRAGIPAGANVELVFFASKGWPLDVSTGNWLGSIVALSARQRHTIPDLPKPVQDIGTILHMADQLQSDRVWMLAPWYPLEKSP